MTSWLTAKTKRYESILIAVARSPVESLRMLHSLNLFLGSQNVGSDAKKVLIRFADLANIFAYIPEQLPVLEFGSGSSTLFFIWNEKVTSLVTYEEKPEFIPILPSKFDKNWIIVSDRFQIEKRDGCNIPRFTNFDEHLTENTIIYVDGPYTPINPKTQSAFPNKELLHSNNLQNNIVLVDCRIETVSLLAEKLRDTHQFFPSQVYQNAYSNAAEIRFGLQNSKWDNLQTNVRTTTFLPNCFFT